MEMYNEFIMTFVIATLIPSFYMLAYVLKGKEKGILAFFKTLLGTFGMYFSSLIPILLMVIMFTSIDHKDLIAVCVTDICAIVFSAPFFSELIKRIDNDFEVPFGFKSHFLTLILFISAGFFIGSMTIIFISGFLAGEVSIFAVIGMLFMLVGIITIMIITRMKNNASEDYDKLEEIKKIEQKIGIVIAVLMLIFFIAVMIF